MNWLCNIIGHARPKQGWWGDGLYGDVRGGAIDGIGRGHLEIHLKCPRCGEKYIAARFHVNEPLIKETLDHSDGAWKR